MLRWPRRPSPCRFAWRPVQLRPVRLATRRQRPVAFDHASTFELAQTRSRGRRRTAHAARHRTSWRTARQGLVHRQPQPDQRAMSSATSPHRLGGIRRQLAQPNVDRLEPLASWSLISPCSRVRVDSLPVHQESPLRIGLYPFTAAVPGSSYPGPWCTGEARIPVTERTTARGPGRPRTADSARRDCPRLGGHAATSR